MISVVILTLVIGAIAAALISVLSLSGSTTKSISDSADSQAVSANLTNDVQSAAEITTSPSTKFGTPHNASCGTGIRLLGLQWNQVKGSTTFASDVSYLAVKRGNTWTLVRVECSGRSPIPASSETVSSDICQPAGSPTENGCTRFQAPPSITPGTDTTAAKAAWISTEGVTGVKFSFTEPGSKYSYTLVANPIAANPANPAGSVVPPNTSCGYGAAGTGTYAQQLCFVSFAAYNYAAAAYSTGKCQTMTAGITGTPFSLSFCLSVQAGTETTSHGGEAPPTSGSWKSSACRKSPAGSGSGVPPPPNPPAHPCTDPSSADVVAVPLPTYTSPPASEAFLGNNGFYTGVPGDPALYTYLEGTDITFYFTNIKVLDQNGNPASHWQLVTGDAESTDAGESITWSTCPATAGGGQQVTCTGTPTPPFLSLIPNNPSSTPPDEYGNACMNPDYTQDWLRSGSLSVGGGSVFGPTDGAQEVECAAGVDEDKTGTVMLQAPEPTTLTVNMVGTGLQAIFLGFLL